MWSQKTFGLEEFYTIIFIIVDVFFHSFSDSGLL